jgi:hypothetical protein
LDAVADLGWGRSTLVSSANGDVELHIDIQAPVWAAYEIVEIYANAATFDEGGFEFSAIPTQTLVQGADFARDLVVVDASVPGASRYESQLTIPFELAEDTWFVVVVRGVDGASEPMFPVYPSNLDQNLNLDLADLIDGNLGERGVLAMGVTNPLFADVDGQPGFQAPDQP